ncbi:hypothetical protein ACTID9_14075 [Brevibacillus fluminis]|uniref:hypothetical protein n=1 Tax=Brevibacillus fluminis TaxID=511487 RepID=UPI003F8A93E9
MAVQAGEELKGQSIPRQHLTIAYGKGTELPRLIDEEKRGATRIRGGDVLQLLLLQSSAAEGGGPCM